MIGGRGVVGIEDKKSNRGWVSRGQKHLREETWRLGQWRWRRQMFRWEEGMLSEMDMIIQQVQFSDQMKDRWGGLKIKMEATRREQKRQRLDNRQNPNLELSWLKHETVGFAYPFVNWVQLAPLQYA
ncbi:hypothetical protein VNO77_43710 [Canavalia gladiata]|uniref:Uncharacterized protein n=1 Tax=Canavalia gladiata TaxID=3824 RepID=A0AAN9JVA7_CANGL